MSDYDRGFPRSVPAAGAADMAVDAGLRGFMLGVYNKLALGLLLSAVLAWVTASYPPVTSLLYVTEGDRLVGFTALGTLIRFAPLVIILVSAFAMRNPSPRSAGLLYWAMVSTIGAGLGVWILAYTGASVALTFLITATAFGALSLAGYTTKKDLTGFGSFLIVGVWGLIIAMFVNAFLHLPGIQLIVSILGVLIFAGLIAYDTQRLKMTYYQLGGNEAAMGVATNYGALSLYIDFINLFQFLMMLFGGGGSRR
jgi:FtsH-binding integral membrane protein